jgi:hypothetical protein
MSDIEPYNRCEKHLPAETLHTDPVTALSQFGGGQPWKIIELETIDYGSVLLIPETFCSGIDLVVERAKAFAKATGSETELDPLTWCRNPALLQHNQRKSGHGHEDLVRNSWLQRFTMFFLCGSVIQVMQEVAISSLVASTKGREFLAIHSLRPKAARASAMSCQT